MSVDYGCNEITGCEAMEYVISDAWSVYGQCEQLLNMLTPNELAKVLARSECADARDFMAWVEECDDATPYDIIEGCTDYVWRDGGVYRYLPCDCEHA